MNSGGYSGNPDVGRFVPEDATTTNAGMTGKEETMTRLFPPTRDSP